MDLIKLIFGKALQSRLIIHFKFGAGILQYDPVYG